MAAKAKLGKKPPYCTPSTKGMIDDVDKQCVDGLDEAGLDETGLDETIDKLVGGEFASVVNNGNREERPQESVKHTENGHTFEENVVGEDADVRRFSEVFVDDDGFLSRDSKDKEGRENVKDKEGRENIMDKEGIKRDDNEDDKQDVIKKDVIKDDKIPVSSCSGVSSSTSDISSVPSSRSPSDASSYSLTSNTRTSFSSTNSFTSISSLVSCSESRLPPVVVVNNGLVPRLCIAPSHLTACVTDMDYFDVSDSLRKSSLSEFNPDITWMCQYNTTLDSYTSFPQIKVIKLAAQFNNLLDYYYVSRFRLREGCEGKESMIADNLDYDVRMFPYLHGLQSYNQREFFGDSPQDVAPSVPLMNLMFVKTDNPKEAKRTKSCKSNNHGCAPLLNTIALDDILVRRGNAYVPFTEHTVTVSHSELNNRNYRDQVRLMAPYSSFVVYNYAGNAQLNTQVAVLLNSLKLPSQCVYVVNVAWDEVSRAYFESPEASLVQNPLENQVHCNTELTCLLNESRGRLFNMEQAMIWRLNLKRWVLRNLCLGNVMDFNDDVSHEFKLVINCNENATMPSLHLLNSIYSDLNDGTTRNNVYYLEFPSAGCALYANMTNLELLLFLNTLKLVRFLVRLDYKMFVFSFDGFTGLSLLTIAIHQLLYHNNFRDAILDLTMRTKLYYFKLDLQLLSGLECAINQLKHDVTKGVLVRDVTCLLPSVCTSDWFDLEKDNNFPSYVMPKVYLGLLNHANSLTVLKTIGVNRLISIGECPEWVEQQREFTFSGVNEQKGVDVVSPIYTHGSCRIYEVDMTKYKCGPNGLTRLVYIYDLKDDGKDLILPLLVGCPPDIQRRFLPEFGGKDTSMIHCRIGVSRLALLLMALMMRHFKVDLLSAYMFLRVQRFNIIIQPNLRIFYELYVYQDHLGLRSRNGLNWETLCAEIYRLNECYI